MIVHYGVIYLDCRRILVSLIPHQINDLAADLSTDCNVALGLRCHQHCIITATAEAGAVISEFPNIPVLPCRPEVESIIRIRQHVPFSHYHVELVEFILVDALYLYCGDVRIVGDLETHDPLLVRLEKEFIATARI